MGKPKETTFVTQPSLPPLDDFIEYLKDIWESKILTNNGKFHQEFENQLTEFLGVEYISLFANGTLALITALQTLQITGEVITTPFSFVATTHALYWNNIRPVFCDIDPIWGNLDPAKIEALITTKTSAIMPVHVYGTPCQIEEIRKIADAYGLKVIYDAAHAFGVTINGNSILNYGDLSILSFHATKTFNTIEGGAIVCHDAETKSKIDYLKNFGFEDEVTVVMPGINAKMNELQAAYGILQLREIDKNILKRNEIAETYRRLLRGIEGIRFLEKIPDIRQNDGYFPIFIEKDYPLTRDDLYETLKKNNIYGRRYFYPLISNLPIYQKLPSATRQNLPKANKIANEVICLPIYPNLPMDYIPIITSIIKKGI
jgi:dTDP-4-amino-4,6-dideoxygalactose transaminase